MKNQNGGEGLGSYSQHKTEYKAVYHKELNFSYSDTKKYVNKYNDKGDSYETLLRPPLRDSINGDGQGYWVATRMRFDYNSNEADKTKEFVWFGGYHFDNNGFGGQMFCTSIDYDGKTDDMSVQFGANKKSVHWNGICPIVTVPISHLNDWSDGTENQCLNVK